jgi:hypothetical protein
MPSRENHVLAALAALGLSDDADRDAVAHAYRRLARATHPDVSDSPDAAARFAALTAAYRRAIAGVDPATLETAAPPAAPAATRVTASAPRTNPYVRSAPTAAHGPRGPIIRPFIDLAAANDPPIVAGPVRWVRSSVDRWADEQDGRGT